MLPPALFSVYRRYKDDTDVIAGWLASTARAAGHGADFLQHGDQQRMPGGRLKGKARREARKATQSSERRYTIPIQSFVPLAKFITASIPAVPVPASLLKTLDRVIAARAGFGSRLRHYGSETTSDDESKHFFFNRVLKEVRDILQSVMPAEADCCSIYTVLEQSSADETLEFASPEPAFSPRPDVERPAMADGGADTYDAEPQNSLQDAVMAFVMLLNDLGRIRSQIEWIWANQRDIAASAVATNTALDLARHLMSEVLPVLEPHGGAWHLTNMLYTYYCAEQGFDADALQLGNGLLNAETYQVADNVFMVSFLFLRSFLEVIQPHSLPLIKEGIFGSYDPTLDRSTMSNGDKFREDQVLLMENFTEAMTIIRLIPGFPVKDEFLRGMAEMDRTREVPYYLVFAAQVFLDINHRLRTGAIACLEFAFDQLSSMSDDLKTHLQFHEELKIDNWPASNDAKLADVRGEIEWIQSDPIFKVKKKQYVRQGMPVPETMQPHRLFKRSPILVGLLLFRYRASLYSTGISVANAWGSISYANHLYNALQKERLLKEPWRDMDLATLLLRDENFFVGEKPSSRNEFLTRFCLQMGISAAALSGTPAQRRRNMGKIGSRAGPRGIKSGIPVSSIFEDRYFLGGERIDWIPERVDRVLSRAEFEVEGSDEDGFFLTKIEDPVKLREIRRGQLDRSSGGKTGDGVRIAPEKLVKSLFLALQAEVTEHMFPYLVLHRCCWRLLRSVKEKCHGLLCSLYTPAYMERESELPFVVWYIFVAAADRRSGLGSDDRLLRQAAEAVGEMLDTGAGWTVLKVLEDRGVPVTLVEEDD